MGEMNGFLTAEQAASELGYHVRHLYKLLREGKIKAQRFNRVWVIEPAEVERVKALQGKGGRLPMTRK